jgi:hypothetical protein
MTIARVRVRLRLRPVTLRRSLVEVAELRLFGGVAGYAEG